MSLANEAIHPAKGDADPEPAPSSQTVPGKGDAGAYARHGAALLQSQDLAGAEQAFRKAVELDPKTQDFRRRLAGVMNRRGSRTKAIELLRPLFEDGTAEAGTCVQLSQMLAKSDDLDGAERAIRRAIEQRPDAIRFRLELVNVMHKSGRVDEAVAMLHELAATTSDPEGLFRIGHILGSRYSDRLGSEPIIRRAIELDPKPDYRIVLADLLVRWNRLFEALLVLWELKAEGFQHTDMSELWAKTVARLGGAELGEEKLQRELQSNPDDPVLRGALAEMVLAQGRLDGAIRILLSRGEDGANDFRIAAMLGRLQAMRGKAVDAGQGSHHASDNGSSAPEGSKPFALPTQPDPVAPIGKFRRILRGFSTHLTGIVRKRPLVPR
jgi:thioredoxin-like negative regulator of GroEL